MKFWVGNTDSDWFSFLSRERPLEINFWQPSGRAPFENAPAGMPFFFKLKYPVNAIAGGGYFMTFSSLPPRLERPRLRRPDAHGTVNAPDRLHEYLNWQGSITS